MAWTLSVNPLLVVVALCVVVHALDSKHHKTPCAHRSAPLDFASVKTRASRKLRPLSFSAECVVAESPESVSLTNFGYVLRAEWSSNCTIVDPFGSSRRYRFTHAELQVKSEHIFATARDAELNLFFVSEVETDLVVSVGYAKAPKKSSCSRSCLSASSLLSAPLPPMHQSANMSLLSLSIESFFPPTDGSYVTYPSKPDAHCGTFQRVVLTSAQSLPLELYLNLSKALNSTNRTTPAAKRSYDKQIRVLRFDDVPGAVALGRVLTGSESAALPPTKAPKNRTTEEDPFVKTVTTTSYGPFIDMTVVLIVGLLLVAVLMGGAYLGNRNAAARVSASALKEIAKKNYGSIST